MEDNYAYNVLQTLMKYPDKTILIVGEEAVTCRQFHTRVSHIINVLKSSLQPDDRVLLAVSPSVDFFCIAIAVLALGGTLVLIDPSMGVTRFNYCVGVSRSAMCIWIKGTKMKWLKYIFPAIKAIPKLVELKPAEYDTDLFLPKDVVPSEHALVTFTTGSTGMPKLLLRQHSFILFQSKSLSHTYNEVSSKMIHLDEVDCPSATNLPVFPLHCLAVGATVLLCTNFTTFDPAHLIEKLHKYKVKLVGGSIAFVHRLAQYAAKNNIILPVKVAVIGGSPVFRGVLRTVSSVIPDKKVIILYGSTEVEPISTISGVDKMKLEESKQDGLCVGLPVVKDSVRIIPIHDDTTVYPEPIDVSSIALPPGKIGEIIVSGWHVNTHQVEEKRLIHDKVDGRVWLRIEDAGYKDTDGHIWLVGRVKWRVQDNKTGQTYWSAVVEQKILERTSKITHVFYLNHNGKAYLFIEAPEGLPPTERESLESFIKLEGIPVDHLIIKPYIARDRRHASKPNTAVLFGDTNTVWAERLMLVRFILVNNLAVIVAVTIILLTVLLYFI